MRKERIAGLCICLVLLGSLQAQLIAGWPRPAAVSLPGAVWVLAAGEHTVTGIDSLIEASMMKAPDWRSSRIWTFVCAGWPPLGFLCNELRLMRQDLKDQQPCKDRSVTEKDSTHINKFKDETRGVKANFQ